jgi:hypothetical protein
LTLRRFCGVLGGCGVLSGASPAYLRRAILGYTGREMGAID